MRCALAQVPWRRPSPLRADHLVLFIAPAHTVDEIVERTTLALRFPHDDLCGIQFHHVELRPGATSSEMDGQTLGVCDKAEMLRQLQYRFAVDEVAGATHIRSRFASLQRDIHDFPPGVGRKSLDKVLGAAYHREVASHRNIAQKMARQAAAAGSEDAVAAAAAGRDPSAAAAVAGHAAAAVAETCNAVAAVAVAIDAAAAVAVASDADAAVAGAVDTDAAVTLASDADATEAVDAITSLAGAGDADTAVAVASDAEATVTGRIHAVGPGGAAGFNRGRPCHAAGKASGTTAQHADDGHG